MNTIENKMLQWWWWWWKVIWGPTSQGYAPGKACERVKRPPGRQNYTAKAPTPGGTRACCWATANPDKNGQTRSTKYRLPRSASLGRSVLGRTRLIRTHVCMLNLFTTRYSRQVDCQNSCVILSISAAQASDTSIMAALSEKCRNCRATV